MCKNVNLKGQETNNDGKDCNSSSNNYDNNIDIGKHKNGRSSIKNRTTRTTNSMTILCLGKASMFTGV